MGWGRGLKAAPAGGNGGTNTAGGGGGVRVAGEGIVLKNKSTFKDILRLTWKTLGEGGRLYPCPPTNQGPK